MHILYWVLSLIWITSVTGEHNRLRRLLDMNNEDKTDVPSLSLFIPPPHLVSIVTDGVKNSTAVESVRQNLIVDPLLALLNEEEANLLQMLLPELFTKNNNNNKIQTNNVQQESSERIGSTSSSTTTTTTTTTVPPLNIKATTLDPIISWLLNGPNDTDTAFQHPATPGPMISMTDDMLISMLQQAVSNFSPTSTLPSTTETVGWTGPVGIGDDLLATLLKTLQDQTEKSVAEVTEPSLNLSNFESVSTTTESLLDTLTTKAVGLQWPDKVKPGGGISDEAIAAIIKDVNEINKNISDIVGAPDLSADFLEDKPVTISDDQVAQLIQDVANAVNTTTLKSDSIEDEVTNGTKTGTEKSKKPTRGKNSASGNTKKGSKTPNRLRKKPVRKPTRIATKKPNLWERLVKAASNAIFGEKKPSKGLFQVDDILDLLSSM